VNASHSESSIAQELWGSNELTLDPSGPSRIARVLLTGFELLGGSADIGPVTLRPFVATSDQQLEEYGRAYRHTCVLELRYRERTGASSTYAEPRQLLDVVFVGLQLVIDGWVGSSLAHHYDASGTEIGTSGGRRTSTADSWHPGGEPQVTADAAFAARLEQTVTAQASTLSNAIHRFSKGCTSLITDSIVDFVVVLDAVLGFGLRDEISHRVAARGALLLATSPDERWTYYTALKYLYGCRSKFVHDAVAEVDKPSGPQRAALEELGYKWKDGEGASLNRYQVAELARRTARSVIWKFISGDARLDQEWLTRLELGIPGIRACEKTRSAEA
jgi:hypothetical protein